MAKQPAKSKKSAPAKKKPKQAPKAKRGRPSFTPKEQHFAKVREAAAAGCSHREIADLLGISYSCFKNHKEQFLPHIARGKESAAAAIATKKVESALLKACLGYSYKEVTTSRRVTADGKAVVSKREHTKRVLPSVAAIEYYLDNRAAAKWAVPAKVKRPIDTSEQIPVSLDFEPPAARTKPAEEENREKG